MDSRDGKGSMDDEEMKLQAAPRRVLDQVHSDFAFAMALQEQERVFSTLPSIESESNEEEEDDDDEDEDDDSDSEYNNYEFFQGFEFEGGDDNVEGQGSNGEDGEEMEEDDIDPDELSYEELMALGEFIGEEKRGLSANEISTCLHQCKYKSSDHHQRSSNGGIEKCVICQVEYEEGETLAAIAACEHPYHPECITKWLQIRKICPICTTEVSSPKSSTNV